ncbi:MAG TPA: hypothetical protein VHP13_00110 [Gammaproteobacteria bacterium]|jgi:hypothetical protein|nr:hypothetical protein [Gammaproteobacteria bacterium]
MQTSKSSAIDEILSKDDQPDHYEPEGRPGRKPGSANPRPAAKPQGRNTQAWRAIEDMKANRRLDTDLKEVYDEK